MTDHRPARLPRGEGDLDEWSVYADALLVRGEPLGEVLAYELALPAAITREQVATFHALVQPHVWPRNTLRIGWCLGHARELEIVRRGSRFSRVDEGTLANLRDLLLLPQFSCLETLSTQYFAGQAAKQWRRVFAVLPPTCTRLVLEVHTRSLGEVEELVAWLPPTVRELALGRARTTLTAAALALVAGRFDRIDLPDLDPVHLPELCGPLDDAAVARVRLDRYSHDDARPFLLGGERDVAFVYPEPGRARILRRLSLVERQGRAGVIPVRAQLARSLAEPYLASARWDGRSEHFPVVARGERWTHQPQDGGPISELVDGERSPTGFVFVARDLDARIRAQMSIGRGR